jgi:hypothetical protein
MAEFPFVMVRFEDILYNQEETVKTACECAGGKLADVFQYKDSAAKRHGGKEGAFDVLRKYGDREKRIEGWRKEDLEFLDSVVDQDLMELFEYLPAE